MQTRVIGQTGIGSFRLRDRVRIYRPTYFRAGIGKNKVEKHLRTFAKGNFNIFPFLQLRSDVTDFQRRNIKLN